MAARLTRRLLHQRKVKKPHRISNRPVFAGVSSLQACWRYTMRAVSYIIALVFVLTGPSLAGSADRDLPGVGTFTYCGTPISNPAPEMLTAIGQ
jgi:hypothetical protein